MAKINILDENLINKIAAGEVIERPASIVKELVENSLDAGAKTIKVEVSDGGKDSIRITDDGEGMTEEDATLSLERHATSKISKDDDLFNIISFGFRGEALASVAAVSKLKIATKTKKSIEGTEVSINGGKDKKIKTIGCPTGTDIQIEDLFFNTPARKKYLSTTATELSHIIDIMQRFALANIEVSFRLFHNGKEVMTSMKKTDMKSKILDVYGMEIARDMIEVKFKRKNLEVSGFVSKPSNTKASKSHQSIFVNNRYVKNKTISDAINDAYHTLLTVGRHPISVINLKIDPKTIDVNVHPSKQQIKIQDEDTVYSIVYDAIRKALSKENLVPDVRDEEFDQSTLDVPNATIPKAQTAQHRKYDIDKGKQSFLSGNRSSAPKSSGGFSRPTAIMKDSQRSIEETSKKREYKILGQVHMNYIVIEVDTGIYIIDQHAAHERVLYEKFMKEKKSVASQELVSPKQLDLNAKELIVLENNLEAFEKLGFGIESIGKNSYALKKVPVILKDTADDEMIKDIINEITEKGKAGKLDSKKEKMIITMACRSAIKQGKRMEDPEIFRLIDELMETENPYTCPHGRPVLISMTLYELEKKFKRVQ